MVPAPIKPAVQTVPQETLQKFLDAIDYRIVRSKEEIEKAYGLVYKEYLKRGYLKENSLRQKYSLFNALPLTATFIATVENEILATASVIPDSPLGLPMDEIYHDELEQFRKENKKVCEVSMLASDTELFKAGISMMLESKKMFFIFSLFKIILDYVKTVLKLDYICITINPKHSLTYDFILFKDFGGLKTYKNANGAPALAKYLDLKNVENECKEKNKEGLYRMFLLKNSAPELFADKFGFSREDLKYFFVDKCDILKTTPPSKLDYIKSCYPDYDFTEIIK
jgi:hypothetical protein